MTTWRLDKWNGYFAPIIPAMTKQEISDAVSFLTVNNYPIPEDCPKNKQCPEFRPACLLFPICRVAKGMCSGVGSPVKCTTCSNMIDADAMPFKDALSRKEFGISGMCQQCQDSVFTPQSDDSCDDCKWKSPEHCKECPI